MKVNIGYDEFNFLTYLLVTKLRLCSNDLNPSVVL